MTNSTSSRFDVYEAITNQIVSAIEAGPGQVQLPWHRKGFAIYRPVNVASKNAYRGVNTVALWAAADAQGFAHGVRSGERRVGKGWVRTCKFRWSRYH